MKTIIKSFISITEDDLIQELETLQAILTPREEEYFNCITQAFYKLGETPTEAFLINEFPELKVQLEKATPMYGKDLEFYIKNFISKRKNQRLSMDVMNLASKIESEGLNEDDLEALKDRIEVSTKEISSNVYDLKSYQDLYQQQKNLPSGMLTFVKHLDDMTGGMSPGTVNTFMAHTGSFKSTWALNIAYNNTYHLGFNIAVISLEVPKDLMLWNLISRHSKDAKFDKYDFISHSKMRYHKLTEEEEDYAFNTVLKDFTDNSMGKLYLLDETDFINLSYSEIRDTLYKLDDMAIRDTGSGLDAIIVDHIGLMKFSNGQRFSSEYEVINNYVSFFRKLSLKFKKQDDGTYSKLTTILLVQANRKGYEEAIKKKGQYSLLAIAEANEVERASYRVYSIYTDDILKESNEALVCLLKNRGGVTNYTPMPVFAEGASYTFGDINPKGATIFTCSSEPIIDNIDFDDVFNDDNLDLFS